MRKEVHSCDILSLNKEIHQYKKNITFEFVKILKMYKM